MGEPRLERIVIAGLDNAGKTVILNRMATGQVVETTPSTSFEIMQFNYNNTQVILFSVAGGEEHRDFLLLPFSQARGLIFVVDATDGRRLDQAYAQFRTCVEALAHGAPIVVFANKQDLENVVPTNEIAESLHLDELQSHPTHVQETCALSGQGLFDGLNWLLGILSGPQ